MSQIISLSLPLNLGPRFCLPYPKRDQVNDDSMIKDPPIKIRYLKRDQNKKRGPHQCMIELY